MGSVHNYGWQPASHSKWDSFRKVGCPISCAVLILAFLVFTSRPVPIKDNAKEAEVKQNLHAIQLALERYAVDHDGLYPHDISAIATPDNLPMLPGNPLYDYRRDPETGKKLKTRCQCPPVSMREISFGDPRFEGNFTYLPWGSFQDGTAAGYYLIAYGSRKTKGQDLDGDGQGDHVVMQLDSPIRFSTTPNIKQQRIPRPDLKELLHPQGVNTGKPGA